MYLSVYTVLNVLYILVTLNFQTQQTLHPHLYLHAFADDVLLAFSSLSSPLLMLSLFIPYLYLSFKIHLHIINSNAFCEASLDSLTLVLVPPRDLYFLFSLRTSHIVL